MGIVNVRVALINIRIKCVTKNFIDTFFYVTITFNTKICTDISQNCSHVFSILAITFCPMVT